MNRVIVLALPLLGLAALWGWTHSRAAQGTEWDVPVEGYDPRDLLRGHYIRFQYDWPLAPGAMDASPTQSLCIEGAPPVITRVVGPINPFGDRPCPHPIRASAIEGQPGASLPQGQLYIPQTQAAGLEQKLRDPRLQGVVRVRVRNDGHIMPLSISFRPRPAATPAP